ncbi:GD25893 [Drosophila simulans]|uniref:GD25893 n=1 Tax=Drosophila simulans TaxID=7240 RepID=B4QBM7_DROSI|nr:GD25893 [Drosophila simulans]
MIPTSVTNSPPPAGLGQNGASASLGSATAAAGGGMLSGLGMVGVSGCGSAGTGSHNNYSSVVLGLASLILEGRPIADYEYQHQTEGVLCLGIATRSGGGNCTQLYEPHWRKTFFKLIIMLPQTMSAEPELVSLAINDLNKDHGDYEIVRRVMLNRAGGTGLVSSAGGGTNNSSAASSPGSNSSDNILHSLQSLATTCLRGGPALAPPPPVESRPLNLGFHWSGLVGSGGRGLGFGGAAASISTTPTTTATATASSGASSSASRPKHGPHCDQFLRKMGLAKGEMPSEAEEHICDMSYVNMTCNRWRAYCMKMEAILARREPVCIEVYLGPVSHKLLLEQWIICGKEKVPPPTMTLPSLCSAIRSQLYFSQIVAWCDLLRKCDPSVYDSGRVIFSNCGNNAGDLATSYTTCGGQKRPRLNIFYRIKQHTTNSNSGLHHEDGFSAKANVHNFPNVNVSENYSISVSVRSLPRINGGLPHVEPLPPSPAPRSLRPCGGDPASTPTGGGGLHAATPTGLGARTSALTPTTTAGGSNCDNGKPGMGQVLDELDGDSSLSHRERQLQKYRKRMQRRDKKRERKATPERENSRQQSEEPMDEGEESQTQSQTSSETQSLAVTLQQPRRIAMISTGTQTSLSSCQQCGSEKTLLCLSCTGGGEAHGGSNGATNGSADRSTNGALDDGDDSDTTASEMEETSSCSLSSADLIVGTPRNNAELLLQAIQRTPKNRNRKPHPGVVDQAPLGAACRNADLNGGQNNNLLKATPATSGCQVCKRQKTQHNFANGKVHQPTNGKQTSNGYASMHQEAEKQPDVVQILSTKLTPNIERCSLNPVERCKTPPPGVADHIVVQFKTPLSQVPAKHQPDAMVPLQQQQLGKSSPKPAQLRLNCGSNLLESETPPPMTSPQMRKALPKVNLTTIFCSSAPIAIGCPAFSFDPAALSHAHSQLLAPDVSVTPPVQKSFSAPTLPHAASLSVSPRFSKQALAAHKRRSRHLSDRSDRSSLGSDEQLSDEDLESGLCSPAGGSPLKCRARLAAHFGGRPLLGNLEESLLQRRLMPKIEVMGFKLQLGASGGFCPTQLTIPAVSYFYELHGETLSTPYLCEIRLPRKGYSVPRSGTVQATLLNPMGTVVRMFVIPYDMRDMPPLHRTFIRQRILAEELSQEQDKGHKVPRSPTVTSTTSKLGHFISAEQMKRLRYSIHLRFQTSRSGRLCLHTDIRLLISRRTDCDTAAAHAKGVLEAPNELVTDTMMPAEPRYSARQESAGRI